MLNKIQFLHHFDDLEDAMYYCEKQYYLQYHTLPSCQSEYNDHDLLQEIEKDCDQELGQYRSIEDDCPEFGPFHYDYEDRGYLLLFQREKEKTKLICLPFQWTEAGWMK